GNRQCAADDNGAVGLNARMRAESADLFPEFIGFGGLGTEIVGGAGGVLGLGRLAVDVAGDGHLDALAVGAMFDAGGSAAFGDLDNRRAVNILECDVKGAGVDSRRGKAGQRVTNQSPQKNPGSHAGFGVGAVGGLGEGVLGVGAGGHEFGGGGFADGEIV